MSRAVPEQHNPIRIMVVDDSSIVRGFLTRFLESDPELKVTASVPNGQAALQALEAAAPDIVILDLDMPLMDGMTALPLLLAARPGIPVLIASTRTRGSAALGLQCLARGATDCMDKPTVHDLSEPGPFRDELVNRVKLLARPAPVFSHPLPDVVRPQRAAQKIQALAFSASTGGPAALTQIFEGLKQPDMPVFVTQHMPAAFTAILAENIAQATGLDAREAVEGETPVAGRIYIAPGDFHLLLREGAGGRVIALSKDKPEHFCRPAADPMLKSLARIYGPHLLSVVLTGMGSDAVAGSRAVIEAGGQVIAQDQASSVVWGMPGAVVQAGLAGEVLPLAQIAAYLNRRLSEAAP